MELNEINNYNETIALFIGMKKGHPDDNRWEDDWFEKVSGVRHSEPLGFHYSWDCLMPVVDKINNIGIAYGDNGFDLIDNMHDALTDVSIQGTYDAIISFIEWYNENNSSNNKKVNRP